jgi:hypothetical protein
VIELSRTTGDVTIRESDSFDQILTAMNIEPLEPRIAPASLTMGSKLLTYTDIDGDLVKVTFTKATMTEGDFDFFPGAFLAGDTTTPQKLLTLNLVGKTGAGFTLTATPQKDGAGQLHGDSHANIFEINGVTTDLGTIKVDGDVMGLNAGDGDFTNGLGLKSLNVVSLGKDGGSGAVQINGLGSLTVKTDIKGTRVDITGGARSITVGGSLIGTNTGNGGAIVVHSGGIGTLKIGGSLYDNGGIGNGNLFVIGGIGTLSIRGSIIGSESSTTSGGPRQVEIIGNVKSATIGGDIIGRSDELGGYFEVFGNVGTMKVGGSVIGSDANFTGEIFIGGDASSISIGGNLVGGDSRGGASLLSSGVVFVEGSLGTLSIGGDFIAGKIVDGGGSLIQSSMIAVNGTVGSIRIGGSVLGDPSRLAYIMAAGENADPGEAAIKTLTVKGSVTSASIVTGYDRFFNPRSLLAPGIGSVSIAGDFAASFVIAGSNKGFDGIPGNSDDGAVNSTTTIRSVKIGGAFLGGGSSVSTYFYIYAPHILSLRVGKVSYTDADLADPIKFSSAGNAIAWAAAS